MIEDANCNHVFREIVLVKLTGSDELARLACGEIRGVVELSDRKSMEASSDFLRRFVPGLRARGLRVQEGRKTYSQKRAEGDWLEHVQWSVLRGIRTCRPSSSQARLADRAPTRGRLCAPEPWRWTSSDWRRGRACTYQPARLPTYKWGRRVPRKAALSLTPGCR